MNLFLGKKNPNIISQCRRFCRRIVIRSVARSLARSVSQDQREHQHTSSSGFPVERMTRLLLPLTLEARVLANRPLLLDPIKMIEPRRVRSQPASLVFFELRNEKPSLTSFEARERTLAGNRSTDELNELEFLSSDNEIRRPVQISTLISPPRTSLRIPRALFERQ